MNSHSVQRTPFFDCLFFFLVSSNNFSFRAEPRLFFFCDLRTISPAALLCDPFSLLFFHPPHPYCRDFLAPSSLRSCCCFLPHSRTALAFFRNQQEHALPPQSTISFSFREKKLPTFFFAGIAFIVCSPPPRPSKILRDIFYFLSPLREQSRFWG